MEAIELTLPYPPSVNRYWRHNRGRTHLSREGREYQNHVRDFARAKSIVCIHGRVAVEIKVSPPDRRRRDVDNTLKALLDGLQKGGVLRDDYQIERLSIERLPPQTGGTCFVTITPIRE